MKIMKFLALAFLLAFFSIATQAALVPPFVGTNEVALRSALVALSNTVNGFTADTNGVTTGRRGKLRMPSPSIKSPLDEFPVAKRRW